VVCVPHLILLDVTHNKILNRTFVSLPCVVFLQPPLSFQNTYVKPCIKVPEQIHHPIWTGSKENIQRIVSRCTKLTPDPLFHFPCIRDWKCEILGTFKIKSVLPHLIYNFKLTTLKVK
jgi:hypothetical protein